MRRLDDDVHGTRQSGTFLKVVAPGRPATFLGDGCLVVVARDALVFDVVFSGSLVTRNQQSIGRVLAVIVAHADAMSVSLGRLDELDEAGAAMLDVAALLAARLDVEWTVIDGALLWHVALNRAASGSTVEPRATASSLGTQAACRRRPCTAR